MYYYCLTIRKCTPVKTSVSLRSVLNVYESYMRYLKQHYLDANIQYHYENVTKKSGFNVHLHCMIKYPRLGIFMSGKKGYSIRLERCKSPMAWQTYISKNPYTKSEMIEHINMLMDGVDFDDVISEDENHEIPKQRLV